MPLVVYSETSPDVNSVSLADSDASLLPQFVSTAHDNVRHSSLKFRQEQL